jgi:hypothetical protein
MLNRIKNTKLITDDKNSFANDIENFDLFRQRAEIGLGKLGEAILHGDEGGYDKAIEDIKQNEKIIKDPKKIENYIQNAMKGERLKLLESRIKDGSGTSSERLLAQRSTGVFGGSLKKGSGYFSKGNLELYAAHKRIMEANPEMVKELSELKNDKNTRNILTGYYERASGDKKDLELLINSGLSNAAAFDLHGDYVQSNVNKQEIIGRDNLFELLKTRNPKKYNDNTQADYNKKTEEYGKLKREFQTLVVSEDRKKVAEFLNKRGDTLQALSNDLQGSEGGQWKKWGDHSKTDGTNWFERLTEEAPSLGQVQLDANVSEAGTDPNTEMINAFTDALKKLARAIKNG